MTTTSLLSSLRLLGYDAEEAEQIEALLTSLGEESKDTHREMIKYMARIQRVCIDYRNCVTNPMLSNTVNFSNDDGSLVVAVSNGLERASCRLYESELPALYLLLTEMIYKTSK